MVRPSHGPSAGLLAEGTVPHTSELGGAAAIRRPSLTSPDLTLTSHLCEKPHRYGLCFSVWEIQPKKGRVGLDHRALWPHVPSDRPALSRAGLVAASVIPHDTP